MYVQDIRLTLPTLSHRPQSLPLHRPSDPSSSPDPTIPTARSAYLLPTDQPSSLGHRALPIRRWRPRRVKQAPKSLYGRIQADGDSKDDKADIEEFGLAGLGARSEVEERGVDEAQGDAEGSALPELRDGSEDVTVRKWASRKPRNHR
jgi:hypothetical protein